MLTFMQNLFTKDKRKIITSRKACTSPVWNTVKEGEAT